MKVAVVMEASPTQGGGFCQALNALQQMQRLCAGRHEMIVVITELDSKPVLDRMGIASQHVRPSWYERLQPMLLASRLLEQVLDRVARPTRLERMLLDQGTDLAYFVSPWWRTRMFHRLNYWLTVWDMAHLDYPEFPEVRQPFQTRERVLRRALEHAVLTVADSDMLAQRISRRFDVHAARVLAMPFMPAADVLGIDCAPLHDVMTRLQLQPGYLFYPAQFWAHKNHIRILEALQICNSRGAVLQAVFAGGDSGQRGHIEATAQAMGLQAQLRFLGFVDPRDMQGLYLGCRALVMPTYFGPTNLPPLEAWALGRPVIYSSHLQEQAGDAALLADPDSAEELADCMLACLDDTRCADLVARGSRRLQEITQQRDAAEAMMADRLARLQARLRCTAVVQR